jgi:hypothetical protein
MGKDDAVEAGDIVVTEDRAKQMAQPPAQKGQQKGRAPAPGAPATTGATPAPAKPTAAAEAPNDQKKSIRAVGPTFISPKQN